LKKVLILGGGFSGLEAAIFLRKAHFEVTLVSERDFFYINPISIWVPTGKTTFDKVCIKLEDLKAVHGFSVIVDKVGYIRSKDGAVELDSGRVLRDYDYMVIAMGAGKMQHPGLEHTLSICGAPEQSLELRERLDRLIAKGSGKIAMGFGGNPKDMSAVRGGPAFEMMFNVEHMLRKRGVRDKFELTMFAPMPEPGKRMGPKALKTLDKMFKRTGVFHRFGKKITGFDAEGISFEEGGRLESDLTMFIPGGSGHPVVKGSDLPVNEAGFICIDDHCKVLYDEENAAQNIYAIGDVAALDGPQWRAKQGHVAEVMARNAAFNIIQQSKGKRERKGYREHLNILCVMDSGNGAAFVYRDDKRAMMIPLPVVGHWLKKMWGVYCRWSKLEKIGRLPGL
jgi:sulfide:quinone oxidoreductase